MKDLILSIDQGTTSTRAILFDAQGRPVQIAQQEFEQHFPHSAWVEHDANDIWASVQTVCQKLSKQFDRVSAIGITNQRETTIVWDRESGQPIYNAIVWQDRRTADLCQKLRDKGHEKTIKDKTGLLLDPYFSATKIAWILDNVAGARARAEQGKLAAGTIDSFLIWRLTGGKVHASDATNASRTSLFNIHTQQWDQPLLDIFNVPKAMLPDVRDCADNFGVSTLKAIGAEIPICGVAGDQQAAAIGQCCFQAGMIKSTYGTGCFTLMNTGSKAIRSDNGLLTTVAYRLNGKTSYALEGSIFIAGAAVQWLRDKLQIIKDAKETEQLASELQDNAGVYLVPAFVGLGAPYWNPHARGALFGITRDTGPAQMARAALESVCFQTHDLVSIMAKDSGVEINAIRVDGGMVNNNWLCQMLANIIDITTERPAVTETTALGAAYLAGLTIGQYKSLDELSSKWHLDLKFVPDYSTAERQRLIDDWQQAVSCVNNIGKAPHTAA